MNYEFRVLKAELIGHAKPDDALKLLDVPPPPELRSGEFAARRKTIQALAYGYKNDLPTSLRTLEEARSLASSGAPALLPQIKYAEAYLAESTDKEVAVQDYQNAIELAQKYKVPLVETDALNNLGHIEIDNEHFDDAIVLSEKALQESRNLHATAAEQQALGNLGWSYYQLGDSNRSIPLLEEAEKLARIIQKPFFEELWSRDLGDVFLSLNDYEKAERYYSNAYSVAAGQDSSSTTPSLENLVQLELRKNNLTKAGEYNKQALALAKSLSDSELQLHCNLNTAEIDIRSHQFPHAEQLLLEVTKKTHDSSLLWQAQSDLANLYVSEKQTVKAANAFNAALQTVENARGKVKHEERRMSILDAWPFYDDYIQFLIHEKQDQKALGVAEFSRARTLAEGLGIVDPKKPTQVSVQKVQHLLKQQSRTILAYWLAEKESYLWLLSPSNYKVWRLPATKAEIDSLIYAYNASLVGHKDIKESSSGQKLYDILVRPAEKLIPKGTRVIIIPHRSLYKLNFETLVVSDPKPHYWIEDFAVEVAGSVSLLADARHVPSATAKKLLLMGAPVQVSTEFGDLPNAGKEIDKVKAHFPAGEEIVLPGKDATPSAYRASHPEAFGIIHFVAHGMASDTNPLDSAIILSPQNDGNFKLYARDIIGIPIKADVVIISACSGAGTRAYSGEGLVGLVWAFLRAGSHQVVGALWDVDDLATPDFMDDFYTALGTNRPAEALRAAKLKMLRSGTIYHKPYYWATLQLYAGS